MTVVEHAFLSHRIGVAQRRQILDGAGGIELHGIPVEPILLDLCRRFKPKALGRFSVSEE
jgi:hypothetical protein